MRSSRPHLLFSWALAVLALAGLAAGAAAQPPWQFQVPAGLHLFVIGGQHFEFETQEPLDVEIFELGAGYVAGAVEVTGGQPESLVRITWNELEADVLNETVVGYRRFVFYESGHPEKEGGGGSPPEDGGKGGSHGTEDEEMAPGEGRPGDSGRQSSEPESSS